MLKVMSHDQTMNGVKGYLQENGPLGPSGKKSNQRGGVLPKNVPRYPNLKICQRLRRLSGSNPAVQLLQHGGDAFFEHGFLGAVPQGVCALKNGRLKVVGLEEMAQK